jgi:hypothetical protein
MKRRPTFFDLAESATILAHSPKLNSADKAEAKRISVLRTFTRRDKESLSRLKNKYRI